MNKEVLWWDTTEQGSANFLFCKLLDSKYFSFDNHTVSVATRLCHYGVKAAVDNTAMNWPGGASIKLYLQNKMLDPLPTK